jgi:hypothetical protein
VTPDDALQSKKEKTMIFRKKERAPGDSPGKTPRAPRYDCEARISIEGFEGEAVMRNVGPGGFRMESRTHREISVHTLCSVRIDPEDGSGIQAFDLEAEVRWVRINEDILSAGFMVNGAEPGYQVTDKVAADNYATDSYATGSYATGSYAEESFKSYVAYRKQSG